MRDLIAENNRPGAGVNPVPRRQYAEREEYDYREPGGVDAVAASWMNSEQRRKMAQLCRRRDHLAARIPNHRGDPRRDKAELKALNWAIHIVENVAKAGLLKAAE